MKEKGYGLFEFLSNSKIIREKPQRIQGGVDRHQHNLDRKLDKFDCSIAVDQG